MFGKSLFIETISSHAAENILFSYSSETLRNLLLKSFNPDAKMLFPRKMEKNTKERILNTIFFTSIILGDSNIVPV